MAGSGTRRDSAEGGHLVERGLNRPKVVITFCSMPFFQLPPDTFYIAVVNVHGVDEKVWIGLPTRPGSGVPGVSDIILARNVMAKSDLTSRGRATIPDFILNSPGVSTSFGDSQTGDEQFFQEVEDEGHNEPQLAMVVIMVNNRTRNPDNNVAQQETD